MFNKLTRRIFWTSGRQPLAINNDQELPELEDKAVRAEPFFMVGSDGEDVATEDFDSDLVTIRTNSEENVNEAKASIASSPVTVLPPSSGFTQIHAEEKPASPARQEPPIYSPGLRNRGSKFFPPEEIAARQSPERAVMPTCETAQIAETPEEESDDDVCSLISCWIRSSRI